MPLDVFLRLVNKVFYARNNSEGCLFPKNSLHLTDSLVANYMI